MLKPRALRPGDTIGIVSPASAIDEPRLRKGCEIFTRAGYQVKYFPHVLAADDYLAGSDQERADDLTAAFADPEVQAIMCSRGGYGCARLLPLIDLDAMAASGKMFLGYSDITTLHLALNRRGLVTFHTPMPLTLAYDRAPWVHESLLRNLRGDATIPADATPGETIVSGTAEGVVTGGCMCLLCDSLSTPDPLETEGKILIVEDVDENPHRIDAMLTHLYNAGLLQRAAGLVFGEMTNTDERSDPTIGTKPWRSIVSERIAPLGIPSILNYPFGHMKTMLSLPLGIRARLDANAGTLTYLESPCNDA